MALRSWLFVPGDSETKLGKVATCGADVVIVDLEDAVAPHRKADARPMAQAWLDAHRHRVVAGGMKERWARINALDTPYWREDLIAVMPGAPDGIMVPKAAGPEQLQQLSAEIYELEQRNGIQVNTTRILPLVSETARSALGIIAYLESPLPRLAGLTWGAEDLSAAIGASRKRDERGVWTDAFRMIRAQVLLAAHARDIMPIDTLHADFRDEAGLERVARESYADGFAGMMAIHPAQVPIINAAFSPTAKQLEQAQAIVDAFSAQPDAGTLQVDGKMVDQPHLAQARRLLESER
ncbi:HpcH/HpaI aldolase/citrate lyase family protein [Paraurantiacibacter namhicola]|uniref:(3S)-malyl-CoA thioesterase n=1 Tax=Paraurantiacibacter namhicola TaxID=645517 RepID=A0A1C7DBR0_9SPHN|nr:CoA ester lyase [Paraurantiacibacter namhicola]ANU08751.1 (3S)-malyl-CoA thioesterase [Paraurantiacibacter namhicola]